MGFYNNLCPGCMNEIGDEKNCPYCGFDTKAEQSAPFLAYGTVLAGKYVVGDILEQNSEGVTYLGLDTITNNCVRIREFLPENFCTRDAGKTNPEVTQEYTAEFKEMRTLFLDMWHKIMKLKTIESMITVLDVFEANDTAYAVAEADGSQTLTEYLYENGGTLEWNVIKEKLFPVLDAAEALHKQGLVHGAISPDTLFLCGNGQFKLWGFGINEIRQTEGKLSADIRPGYAAAEQYGKTFTLSEATDVYGFVTVLYKCVTGSAPIDAEIRMVDDSLEIPAVYARELPDYVLAAFIGALQVLPEDRISSITLLKNSFTKEAYEKHKKDAAVLTSMSLIDPISDIDTETTVKAKPSAAVIVNPTPEVPVLTKEKNTTKTTSTASTIFLSLSIVLVMVIFFVCLLLTGIVSFNVGGFSGSLVEMPNFENYRKDDAYIAQVAEKYGLHITLQPASSSEIAKDVIFDQDIAPGTKIAKGSEITLTYSKGASTVTLPNFTGVPFTETVYYLGKLNLSYNIIEKPNTGGQTPGHVATMSPAAGSIVYEGTEITIEIWGDPAGNQDITGPNTGSQITSSDSIIDSVIGSLSDSVSGLGSTIQSFFS